MMEKINSFKEVILFLKNNVVLTSKRKDFFVYKNENVYRYFNGSAVAMKLNDFMELYKDEVFYLYEEDNVFIDNLKDEDYYRYYKK